MVQYNSVKTKSGLLKIILSNNSPTDVLKYYDMHRGQEEAMFRRLVPIEIGTRTYPLEDCPRDPRAIQCAPYEQPRPPISLLSILRTSKR